MMLQCVGAALTMAYGQDYFDSRKYSHKQQLVERHVQEVLQWATKNVGENLLCGQGKSALDIGCAYGYTSRVLASLGYETVGVDVSAWGTKQAKSILGGEFLVCDVQTPLPFNADKFDLVTCFDVLEHLPNPEKALSNMFNVCKRALVCTTPNKKVEKPIRKLMRDYDETHISVKTSADWHECAANNLATKELRVEAFHDLAFRFSGKLCFKSFSAHTYGLTVRIAATK
jgi:2-polyprenyl-3-methyl-5-hydroxy-6-metoxy-1,4-benzoquinol methylase